MSRSDEPGLEGVRARRRQLRFLAATLALCLVVWYVLAVTVQSAVATTYKLGSGAAGAGTGFEGIVKTDCSEPFVKELTTKSGTNEGLEPALDILALENEDVCGSIWYGGAAEPTVQKVLKEAVEADTKAVQKLETAVVAVEAKIDERGYTEAKPLYVSSSGGSGSSTVTFATASEKQIDGDTEALEVPMWVIVGVFSGAFIMFLFVTEFRSGKA